MRQKITTQEAMQNALRTMRYTDEIRRLSRESEMSTSDLSVQVENERLRQHIRQSASSRLLMNQEFVRLQHDHEATKRELVTVRADLDIANQKLEQMSELK